MLLKDSKRNNEYLLEEEIEDIVRERFTSPAPTSFEDLMDKFVFNKEFINETALKTILSNFSYTKMTNVNKIYILSVDDLQDYQSELIDCDIDGMLFSGVLGIHNIKSGNVVVCLEHHDRDDLTNYDQSLEVVLTFLHEVGHAVQMSDTHNCFFEAVEFIRYVNDYYLFEDQSIEILEADAEDYAHRNMRMIEFNLEIEGYSNIFETLINWDKIEF